MNTDEEIETAAQAAVAGFSYAAGFWAIPLVAGDHAVHLVTYLVFRAAVYCQPDSALQSQLESALIRLLPGSRALVDHLSAVAELIRRGVNLDQLNGEAHSLDEADLSDSREYRLYVELRQQSASRPWSAEFLLPLLRSADLRIRAAAMEHVGSAGEPFQHR